MATLTANAAQTGVQPKGLKVGLIGVRAIYSIDAAPSAGDVIQMVKVPAKATPIFLQYGSSNATPSYLMEVGDGINTARYRSIATYSIAAGMLLANANIATMLPPYTYTADDTIDIFISTVTASNATIGGSYFMNVIFSMDV